VYLYGSEAITYLYAILSMFTESALCVRLSLTPTTGSPPPLCMAEEPVTHLDDISTKGWLNYHTYVKKLKENLYG
jgi:hypothetical protein